MKNELPLNRWLAMDGYLILLLLVSVLLGGCARTRSGAALPQAPPYDPAALQARSLELARKIARQQQDAPPSRDYEIGSLDILEITVFEVPKYSTTTRVSSNGTIHFPDLGIVVADKLNERQLEERIELLLKEKGLLPEPQVMVFVKELHAREAAITGEVKTPGVYPLRGGEGLIDLISKAGGLTPAAGNYALILNRNTGPLPLPLPDAASDAPTGKIAYTSSPAAKPPTPVKPAATLGTAGGSGIQVDLVGLLVRGESRWNIPLRAGDRVTIPAMGWVHVTGLGVAKPGTFQLRNAPNMLRQVIDEAGGLRYSADPRVLIVRRNIEGGQETFTVDYNTIREDTKNDIMIHGGDTIIVNQTPVKAVLSSIGTGISKIARIDVAGYIPLYGR